MYTAELDYWRAARRRRRIPLNAVAKELSAALGEDVSYNNLANWEYGKTHNPSRKVWRAIEHQIQVWGS